MAKMTYEEAITFMEQHAVYCTTGTRPDWHTNEPLPRSPVYWIRLAEYMNKKEEAERVLNAEMQKILHGMLDGTDAIGVVIQVRDGDMVTASLIQPDTNQPGTGQPSADDLARIKPVGGIQ